MDKTIKKEETIKQLLEKMPRKVANSFTEQQLSHLYTALGTKKWSKHSVDVRGTFRIPFIPKRYYYVFLFGKNQRDLSRNEKQISFLGLAFIISLLVVISTMTGLLFIYLLKSALGIDILDGTSLGIWDWFENL